MSTLVTILFSLLLLVVLGCVWKIVQYIEAKKNGYSKTLLVDAVILLVVAVLLYLVIVFG
jgi:hypothetical protein